MISKIDSSCVTATLELTEEEKRRMAECSKERCPECNEYMTVGEAENIGLHWKCYDIVTDRDA